MKGFKPYEHKAQYYETDQMGIIHHSNYIRWMEEARIYFLDQLGISYQKMEESGVISPVVEVYGKYRQMVKFGDTVLIDIVIRQFNGIKMTIGYEVMDKETKQVKFTGESRHCFLNEKGIPVSLKRAAPRIYDVLLAEYKLSSQDADK